MGCSITGSRITPGQGCTSMSQILSAHRRVTIRVNMSRGRVKTGRTSASQVIHTLVSRYLYCHKVSPSCKDGLKQCERHFHQINASFFSRIHNRYHGTRNPGLSLETESIGRNPLPGLRLLLETQCSYSVNISKTSLLISQTRITNQYSTIKHKLPTPCATKEKESPLTLVQQLKKNSTLSTRSI